MNDSNPILNCNGKHSTGKHATKKYTGNDFSELLVRLNGKKTSV